MGALLQDLKYAARRLARSPGFTLTGIAILAVGIGANTAVFSLVDALAFRPPPFERPEEIVSIWQDTDEGEPGRAAYPAYRDLAAMTDVFAAVGGVSAANPLFEAVRLELTDGPRVLSAWYATAGYLPVLGLEPTRGRWFGPEHDAPGAGAFAVVSYRAWRTLFDSDPGLVGRTVRMNGQPVTVIGVGPEKYSGPAGALVVDVWLSISSTFIAGPFRVANLDRREDHWYEVSARLAPGVTVARARAAVDALASRLGEEFPEVDRGRGFTVFTLDQVRLSPDADGMLRGAGLGLLAIVGLLLILACSNLANLILVRGVSRSAEMAVRRALGASQGRVARLFLLESLLLVALGGAAGLLVARAAIGLVPLLPIPTPAATGIDVVLDGRVVGFALVLTLAAGVVFGLAPALRSLGVNLSGALRDQSRSASSGRGLALARGSLVGVQVATSLVLVALAGLMVRSFVSARTADLGFEPEGLALLVTDLEKGGFTAADAPAVREQIMERMRAVPGVVDAAVTSRAPVSVGGSTTTVVEGYTPPSGTGALELNFARVSANYFETLGLPVRAGRGWVPDDFAGPPAVLVNEAAARLFWGGDAVGKRLRPQTQPDAWRTVIGVVADSKVASVREPATPMYFLAAEQVGLYPIYTVVVRTAGDATPLLPALRAALRDVGPALPLDRLATMETHLGEALAGPRTAATFMGGFSLLALLLASLGVYAMVSFAVAGRAAEMGVRVAMGAPRSRLVAMVVRESLVPVTIGMLVGLAVALAAAPALSDFSPGVAARDPVTLGGSALLLMAVATLAAWLPAWRASRIDPVEALRAR